ncbi:hypothetical protein H4R34_002728 [Dimargaris verticillata]|uniref:Peptidase S8/S53 domain-containing protein n=1 Tax=Dimargaris verticillata TaxID=2761393 RepID=A0A9W8B5Z4_9FUNG|nr:hypothetical protein H4R34_002728 [Dimargaris verticillata]
MLTKALALFWLTAVSSLLSQGDAQQKTAARYQVRRQNNPGSFIIETDPALDLDQLTQAVGQWNSQLDVPPPSFAVREELKGLFHGYVVDSDSLHADDLKSLPGVQNVWENSVLELAQVDNGAPGIGGSPYDADYQPEVPASEPRASLVLGMIGVDALHKQGLTGKGIKVGVIDTGIYYNHTAFGNCWGQPDCRIKAGHDFTRDGTNMWVEGEGPVDNCESHGTHVSGIIGGHDESFLGVAYEADIYPYRIFNCATQFNPTEATLVKALTRAHADGVDIINISMGFPGGWADSPLSKVADRLAAEKVLIVSVVGNFGHEDTMFSVVEPAAARGVLAVTAVNSVQEVFRTMNATVAGMDDPLEIIRKPPVIGADLLVSDAPLTLWSDDPSNLDGCQGGNVTDLIGKVVVTSYGSCTSDMKIINALKRGALGIIVYNTDDTVRSISQPMPKGIMATSIGYHHGLMLTKMVMEADENGEEVFITTDAAGHVLIAPAPGQLSTFSSKGPGLRLEIKPEIAAPGYEINSALSVGPRAYGVASGTSMASPHVAGGLALLLQANVTRDIGALRSVLMTTARPIQLADDSDYESVAFQGAGVVNFAQALATLKSTTFAESGLELLDPVAGKFVKGKVTKSITIVNHHPMAQLYHLSYVPSASYRFLDNSGNLSMPINATSQATVSFSKTTVRVFGNDQLGIDFTVRCPSNKKEPFVVYSGYIKVTLVENLKNLLTDTVTFRPVSWTIPFLGLNSDYSKVPYFANLWTTNPGLYNPVTGSLWQPPSKGNPKVFLTYNMMKQNVPTIAFGFQMSVQGMRAVVCKAESPKSIYLAFDTGYSTNVDRYFVSQPRLSLIRWNGTGYRQSSPSVTAVANPTQALDDTTVSPHQQGTIMAPDGKYVIKLLYTSPLGRPENPQDVKAWTSPVFEIKRAQL